MRTRGNKMEERWSVTEDFCGLVKPRVRSRLEILSTFSCVSCTVFIRMLYLASSSSKETPIIHANGFKRFEFVVAGQPGSTDGKRATGPRCSSSKMGKPDDGIFRCNVVGAKGLWNGTVVWCWLFLVKKFSSM